VDQPVAIDFPPDHRTSRVIMRFRSLISVTLAICVGALSGCGTVLNLASPKPLIYGGLAQDMKFLENPPHWHNTDPKGAMVLAVVLAVVVPTEFCCTAVLDTLTLPITVALDNEASTEMAAHNTASVPPSAEAIFSTDRRPTSPP
jgi:uncharacterized protein YceK